MVRIKQLPPDIANQIAAGEVVERPASVIKELVENAIDAKASHIHIDIVDGGSQLMRIRDNGRGIDKADLPLSVKAHATSKIETVEELMTVNSLGFRGEALASISAVSQFKITSKTATAEHAYALEMHGGLDLKIEEAAHPQGTSIEVRELFYNVPVRRKFLKSPRVEFSHIETVVKRIALSRFDIAFNLSHNGKMIYQFPICNSDSKKLERIARVFGKAFVASHLRVKNETAEMSLEGFVCDKDFMRSQNDLQYLYLNGRMIKDKLICHAIRKVYEPLLHPGRQACFLLYLNVARHLYDVNVHPAKHEVRFISPREVHDFIVASLNQVLMGDDEPLEAPKVAHRDVRPEATVFKPRTELYESLNVNAQDFISIGGDYGLLSLDEKQCVFNYIKLYQQNLRARIEKALIQGDLPARPLLIPVQIEMDAASLSHYPFDLLSRFGFNASAINEGRILVRSIPVMTPHCDIHKAINSLVNVHDLDLAIDKIASAQNVNYEALSESERGDIVRFLHLGLRKAKKVKSTYRLFHQNEWDSLINA